MRLEARQLRSSGCTRFNVSSRAARAHDYRPWRPGQARLDVAAIPSASERVRRASAVATPMDAVCAQCPCSPVQHAARRPLRPRPPSRGRRRALTRVAGALPARAHCKLFGHSVSCRSGARVRRAVRRARQRTLGAWCCAAPERPRAFVLCAHRSRAECVAGTQAASAGGPRGPTGAASARPRPRALSAAVYAARLRALWRRPALGHHARPHAVAHARRGRSTTADASLAGAACAWLEFL